MTDYLFVFGCHVVHTLVKHQGCTCIYIIVRQHQLARFKNGPCHPKAETKA